MRGSIIDHKLKEQDIAFFRDGLKRAKEWRLEAEVLNEFENYLNMETGYPNTIEDIKYCFECALTDWDVF